MSRRVSSEASSEFAAAPSARISASAPSGRQALESHGSLSRRGHKGWGPLGWQITLSATHMSLCPHPHDDPPIGALGGHCASSWWHWVLGVKVNVRHASDSLSDLRSQPDVEMSSSQMVQPTGEEEAASVGTEERDNARLGFVVIANKVVRTLSSPSTPRGHGKAAPPRGPRGEEQMPPADSHHRPARCRREPPRTGPAGPGQPVTTTAPQPRGRPQARAARAARDSAPTEVG